MSTLISINLHTLGCRRTAQKKSAKSQDDPEDLRKQRVLYEKCIRKSKKDKILEEKRKVLEKLNWTVAWSDDEDDTEEGQVTVEYLLTTIVELESNIKSFRSATIASMNNHETYLKNLSRALDVCRKKLRKEVDLTLSSTARFRQPVPGPLSSALLSSVIFEVILRILVHSHSSSLFASHGLTITREITTILSDLTRFNLAIETLLSTPACNTGHPCSLMAESLQSILQNSRMDLVCFTNSFNILNHIVSSPKLQSHVNCQTLFGNVLSHLTRALNVHGPEEIITNLYIKSTTQLLTSVIKPLFKQQDFLEDQNFCITFDQILSVLESLFGLRDAEVALNVMKVLAFVSETSKGLHLLFQRQSLTRQIISVNESYVDCTSDQTLLKVCALSYQVIANMVEAEESLCGYFLNEKFFDQAYNGIRTNDFDIDYHLTRILFAVIQFEPRSFELFFDRKLTDYFASVFFMSDNRTQLKLLDIVHEMCVIATPDQAHRILKEGFICCTENFITTADHGYEATHKALEIHRHLMIKSVQGDFQEEALDICGSIKSHLEKVMVCKNQKIVEEAIHLLEGYFESVPDGSFSPTSRIH